MKDTARELPEVTAIIPVYNMERYAERSLASAIAQTYPRLRVLVIDDGSTDRSLEICRRVAAAHPNIEVISGPNAGVAVARNKGTELAGTEYVAYLDADDLWHPSKIARQVAALLAHGSEWGACYTLFRAIDDDDAVLFDGVGHGPRGAFLKEHLLSNHVGNGSSLLVRRAAALAVGGFDPSHARLGIGGCEDYDFQLKLLREHKIELVPEFLVGYRQHEGQMSSDSARMGRGIIAVIDKHARETGMSRQERKQALASWHAFVALLAIRNGQFRGFVRSVAASLRLSPRPCFSLGASFIFRRLEKLIPRAKPRAGAGGRRPFDSYDPSEGVDAIPISDP